MGMRLIYLLILPLLTNSLLAVDSDDDGLPDHLENDQLHKLSLNMYGTNFLYLNAFQAGSFSDYDNLSIVNLDTGETFYEDDFSTNNENWIYVHCNDTGNLESSYVNNSLLARIESGLLRLETIGYMQNGSGGYNSETGAVLKLNLPENYSVSFDIRRNQWAGHTYVKILGSIDNYLTRSMPNTASGSTGERIDQYAYLFQWGGSTFRRVSTLSSDLTELLDHSLSGSLSTGSWHRLEFIKQNNSVTLNVNGTLHSQHSLPEYDYSLLGDNLTDSDNDGLLDGIETNTGTFASITDTGTDPNNADSDGDGLSDSVETNTGIYVSETNTGTDPNNPDSDGDGLSDGLEVHNKFACVIPQISGSLSWYYAKQDAETRGGHLATIHGELENSIVSEIFELARATSGASLYTFIGGTDENSEGEWEWVTGEEFTYTNWNRALGPDNDGGAQHYLDLGWGNRPDGEWDDTNATDQHVNCYMLEIADTGTDPNNADTDGDGVPDSLELTEGTDPNDPSEYPASNLGYFLKTAKFSELGSNVRVSALSSDGNTLAAKDYENDFVTTLRRINGQWIQVGNEISNSTENGSGIISIALSEDGNRLAIAEGLHSLGGGFVKNYQMIDGEWVSHGSVIQGSTSFGGSIDLSADGNTLVVGNPYQNINGVQWVGEVKVFHFVNGEWTQLANTLNGEEKVDMYGNAVSISSDGSRIAVGAFANDGHSNRTGKLFAYTLVDDTWIQLGSTLRGDYNEAALGASVAISGDGNVMAAYASRFDQAGRTYIFRYSGNEWVALGDFIVDDNFTYRSRSISLSQDGSLIAIGQPISVETGTEIYQLNDNAWNLLDTFDSGIGSVSLSSDGNNLLVLGPPQSSLLELYERADPIIDLGTSLTLILNADSTEYSVSDCLETTSGSLDIPSIYNGLPVTSIGNSAFKDCIQITSITIPDSVTLIEAYAFNSCSSLTNIIIGNAVTSIGEEAFEDCSSLSSVTIPDSVITIGEEAFEDCYNLTNVNIGNSVVSIGNLAFAGSGLTSIVIPDSVTEIGNGAFVNCTSLTSITIPDSVISIGTNAFSNCTSLTSVTIPDSVTSIGVGTFSHCTNLSSITIPDSVTSIRDHAFSSCSSLSSITIPDSVTSIGGYAFSSCTSLTSITIPDSVTSIGNYAFYACSSLSSITIPGSMTSIGAGVFYSCTSLTSITIPDGVTSIGTSAFYSCTSLTSITIPDSVASIGRNAFGNIQASISFSRHLLEATEAERDARLTMDEVKDSRVSSTMIEVSEGKADITMTLEETSDLNDWSNATTSEKTIEVDAPPGTRFYRFKMTE